ARRIPRSRQSRRYEAARVYLLTAPPSPGSARPRISLTMLYSLTVYRRSWSIGEMTSYGGAVSDSSGPADGSNSRPVKGRTRGIDAYSMGRSGAAVTEQDNTTNRTVPGRDAVSSDATVYDLLERARGFLAKGHPHQAAMLLGRAKLL